MVADQRVLDGLLELHHRASTLAEWDEPLLRFGWDNEAGVLTVYGIDGVPERRELE